jgi:hypothetical protein
MFTAVVLFALFPIFRRAARVCSINTGIQSNFRLAHGDRACARYDSGLGAVPCKRDGVLCLVYGIHHVRVSVDADSRAKVQEV